METQTFEQEIKEFAFGLASGKPELAIERKTLKMAAMSFLLLLVLGFFLYMFSWKSMPSFSSRLPYFFYGALSSVAIIASIAHYRSHKSNFTCMEGMMIGMTIGMAAGFLFGAIVGATNGMFVGSAFGMAIGMLSGVYCGKCCGIMGAMEGMMAGLMGGTMGAMLTVMMIFDNLALFMPIFVASCLAILAGLAYMIYTSAGKRGERVLIPFSKFLLLSILLAAMTAVLVLYGPKGPLTV